MENVNNKTDIEDFVKNNKSLFDTEEPLDGHFERFKSKLENQKKPKRFLYNSLKYAAVILFFISTFMIYKTYFKANNAEITAENNVDAKDDFNDIKSFYNSQLDEKLKELNSLSCKNDEKQNIQNDFEELNNEYNELLTEYKSDPNNNLIKNALISNYRLRIDTLGRLINNLKKYC